MKPVSMMATILFGTLAAVEFLPAAFQWLVLVIFGGIELIFTGRIVGPLQVLRTSTGAPYSVLGLLPMPSAFACPIWAALSVGSYRWWRFVKAAEADRARQEEMHAAQARQLAEEAARRERVLRALEDSLLALGKSSAETAAQLPSLLRSADEAIERAESEFEGGYLDPFWDAIEEAVFHLASFELNVRVLNQNARTYVDRGRDLTSLAPFPLDPGTLPNGSAVAQRMQTLVRQAQQRVDFSQIYHLRKTNQLLVTGFGTLAGAIAEMADRVKTAVHDLRSSLEDGFASARAAQVASSALIASAIASAEDAIGEAVQAQAERDQEELAALERIERRLPRH